jgi:hypothetical protein
MRPRISYANVVATLALVVAVGTGGAWAATKISGRLLQNRSVAGKKLKKNTVTGKEVKEGKLGKVRKAGEADSAFNAARLGGIAATGFVKGAGTHLAGRTTGAGGGNDNVIRTFETSAGQFQLICPAASASLTYVNTTEGDADVFQTFTFGGSADTTYALLAKDTGDVHFAATPGTGPAMVEQRASKGNSIAIMRVSEVRSGNTCIWNWDLFTSG